jgi:hypothetical protein
MAVPSGLEAWRQVLQYAAALLPACRHQKSKSPYTAYPTL